MIRIVCGTNRHGSMTSKVASLYHQLATELQIPSELKGIEALPEASLGDFIYRKDPNPWREFSEALFSDCERILIVAPEYNGSIPGILKLLIDCCDPGIFVGKKIALAGVGSGRGGNLLGMDDLTNMMHYLKAEVYSNKLPISRIRQLLDAEGRIQDMDTLQSIRNQLVGFSTFG